MSAELERIKRIIRGLLSKTEEAGCTEHEAMANAAKAGELLQQYDLEITDVLLKEEKCVQQFVFAPDGAAGSVISGIGRLCGLKVYQDVTREGFCYVMFGMERDVLLGVFLYELCAEAAEVGWTATIQAGHGFKRASRDAFRAGFAQRVYQRLDALYEERKAAQLARTPVSGSRDLVLVREQMVEEEFAKTGVRLGRAAKTKVHDRAAFSRGKEHGDTVNLSNPVGQESRPAIS